MARRKPKAEPASLPSGDVVVDLLATEAEAHANADLVTDPTAFDFPGPADAVQTTLAPVTAATPPAGGDASAAGADPSTPAKAWNPLFGVRADHEVGVGLLEDKRYKQMQIRFAELCGPPNNSASVALPVMWCSTAIACISQFRPVPNAT